MCVKEIKKIYKKNSQKLPRTYVRMLVPTIYMYTRSDLFIYNAESATLELPFF